MVNSNAVSQPPADLGDDEKRIWEEERKMREFLASLPPPPSIEELARAQGVKPNTMLDDLPRWPEDDLAAWDGFDEFLEELRQGQRERAAERMRDADADLP